TGKQEISNVLAPGDGFIQISAERRPPPAGQPARPEDPDDNELYVNQRDPTIRVQLTHRDIGYSYMGTHYVVTFGSFRGHYFDPPDWYPYDRKKNPSPGARWASR